MGDGFAMYGTIGIGMIATLIYLGFQYIKEKISK